MNSQQFAILPPLEFLKDVRYEAREATKRIYLQAMEVEPGELSSQLLETLEQGALKGLDTRLHVDHYSLLVTDGIFNYLPLFSKKKTKKRKERLKHRIAYFTALQEKGVTLTFTNPPSLLERIIPIIGRNHIKIAIVDDVAYIGGINYHDDNFKSNDCMVKLTDSSLVEAVTKIFMDIEKGRLKDDLRLDCRAGTSLFVDGGKIGRSIILDEAAKLIGNAKESVTVITPIIPDTTLSVALSKAIKRNVTIQVLVPAITNMQGVYFFLDLYNEFVLFLQRKRIPLTILNHPIHAKVIIVDNTTVLLGSHNFTSRGVVLGTEEIAILSSDEYFVTQAHAFIQHVAEKRNSSVKG